MMTPSSRNATTRYDGEQLTQPATLPLQRVCACMLHQALVGQLHVCAIRIKLPEDSEQPLSSGPGQQAAQQARHSVAASGSQTARFCNIHICTLTFISHFASGGGLILLHAPCQSSAQRVEDALTQADRRSECSTASR